MPTHALTDAEARKQLEDAGVKVSESQQPPVSFESLQQEAVDGIVLIKTDSNCEITIIGGTEDIAEANPGVVYFYSLRTMTSACLDKYITRNSDFELYDKEGPIYRGPKPKNYLLVREESVWRINFEGK